MLKTTHISYLTHTSQFKDTFPADHTHTHTQVNDSRASVRCQSQVCICTHRFSIIVVHEWSAAHPRDGVCTIHASVPLVCVCVCVFYPLQTLSNNFVFKLAVPLFSQQFLQLHFPIWPAWACWICKRERSIPDVGRWEGRRGGGVSTWAEAPPPHSLPLSLFKLNISLQHTLFPFHGKSGTHPACRLLK